MDEFINNQNIKYEFGDLVGVSPKIKEVHDLIQTLALQKITVLITGETGTGKELVAQAIHKNSHRYDKPFIAVNCSSIPEGLLETELFGHEKGSFTGATYQKKGAFELADGGILLLDEIGDMPKSLQAKILRTIELNELRRVGGEKQINVNVRLISSTNKDLVKEVLADNFRKDLYYRINVARIDMPTLRERSEDIPFLVKRFISQYNEKCKKSISQISPEALSMLQRLHWDGNVRELKNFIENIISTIEGDSILPEHLSHLIKRHGTGKIPKSNFELDAFSKIIERKVTNFKPNEGVLMKVEKEVINEVLFRTHWNKSGASRILGISLNALKSKIKKYGLINPKDSNVNYNSK